MPSEDNFQIFWQDQLIGCLQDSRPDMWYLEGNWISNNTIAADTFKAAALSLKDVFNHLERGIEVSLKDSAGCITLAVVIVLKNDSLFLRRLATSLKRLH
jgi:hypothetical protein